MNKWNYIATKEKEDAYENIVPILNSYVPDNFKKLDKDEQNLIIDKIIKEIRKINIFPIYYYNKIGIEKEIKKCIKSNPIIDDKDKIINIRSYQGQVFLDYMFPNLFSCYGNNNISLYEQFYNDSSLTTILRFTLKHEKISNMRNTFIRVGRLNGQMPTNYNPMRAKAIYEKYCPKNGIIYDYSCGFGGRMLGALTSKNNYTYIGVEPCIDTYNNLLNLGKEIENITKRNNSYRIYNECSEEHIEKNNSIDFIFSCPPFFNLEHYSNENTQSENKFPNYNDWINYYILPTCEKCYNMLKPQHYFMIDINNYSQNNQYYSIVEDWLKCLNQVGFTFVDKFFVGTIGKKNRKKVKNDSDLNYIYLLEK